MFLGRAAVITFLPFVSPLSYIVLADALSVHLNFNKVKQISARNTSAAAWRLLIDTYVSLRRRCLFPSSATPPLQVCAGAAQLLVVLEECMCSLGGNL